ncbi:MAG: phosphoribosyl-ATP diphosphatase [Cohaesibacteraceae bacterium]
MSFTLHDLEGIIAERAAAPVDKSYTASLSLAGMPKASQKLGEEAVETVIAAMEGDQSAITSEAADLIYHLLVVLRLADIPLDNVLAELARRTAQSGLEEKAARNA